MSYPPTALLGDPPSREIAESDLSNAVVQDRPAAHALRCRTPLRIDVTNADPTGDIVISLDPHGAGNAAFSCEPADVGIQIHTAGVTLEFVAVDGHAAHVSVGAGMSYAGDPICFSLDLVVSAWHPGGFSTRADCAPGTDVDATAASGVTRSLSRGPAAWAI